MKQALLSLLLLLAATVASAQEIVKGDMNGDNGFISDAIGTCWDNRCGGRSVRPVRLSE